MPVLSRRIAAAVAVAAVALPAAAADTGAGWPAGIPQGWNTRGTGGGLAILPAVLSWLVILGWIRSVDWISRDATKHKFTPAFWGMVCGLPLFVAALFAWWIPSVIAGLALLLVAWLAPAVTYCLIRNKSLPLSEQVLTVGHARRIVAGLLQPLGIEIAAAINEGDVLPKVQLAAAGGKDAAENAARLEAATKLPGFEEARKTMLTAVMARAATLVIDCEPAGMAVRHEVDGVWEKPRIRRPPKSRKEKETWVEAPKSSLEVGQAVVAVLKTLAGLPAAARDAKTAPFLLQVDGKPRNCRLSVRAQPTGEQLVIQFEPPAAVFKKLTDLGMPEPLAEKLIGLAAVERGLILVSSPPASGLTTTFDILVQSADRLLRDFISLEDAAAPAREIQNVKPVPFDARTGVRPLDALADVLRTYPNVIVTRDVRDKALVAELLKLADEDKFVIMSLKASDAADAIARILACGVPPQLLAKTLVGCLSQRLVRKLCPKCREDYPPPAELLARLRLTPEQLPHLRKASPHGCRLCGGTGYLGRTAIHELASGATLRKAIAAGTDTATVRKAAIQDGMKQLRDAGMALVLEGVTSLEELQRVFAVGGAAPAAATGKGVATK
ncbi:MAG: Flp pilus assembly complex ATPase component TadA [Planctomycetia bacterium]|nr:Flp pilus assembly complex ATPase component TadA [Planctomycetia bacterium]